MGTFDDYLGPVAASVPPTLISAPSFSGISSVARVLPAILAHNTFGFECRLGEEDPRADFLVLARTSWGRDSLAGLNPTSSLPKYLLDNPVWRRVQDFAGRWADPASPLYGAVDNVWLEFDVDGPARDIPVPSVFFGLLANGVEGEGFERALEEARETTLRALRLLSGTEPPPRVLETLTGCFRALSPGEQVFQVGLMLSRGAAAVRLCIQLGALKRAVEYLAEVAWPGSGTGLLGVLGPVARIVDRVYLDIDAGETVHPKVGLECYFDGNRQPRTEPRWETLLGHLVANGLCTPEKREALLAYPGYADEEKATVSWPEEPRRASRLLGGRSLSTFIRSIHHVKVVYQPGEKPEAKAYLAANHHWHTPPSRAVSTSAIEG
jgi:hypothetical protein